jgi:hypothetical protein
MKITQHTPTQLTLRHTPIALWLIGSIFTIIGVITLILFSKASTFTCERVQPNQGNCELIHAHFVISKTLIISLHELKNAEIVMTRNRQIDSFFLLKPHYRVTLLTSNQRIPLSIYGSTKREKQDIIAAKINAFLKNAEATSLLIKQDNRWLIYFISGLLIIIGLFAELSKILTITFDKTQESLKIERHGLLGTQCIEHSLQEIKKVKLNTSFAFNSRTVFYQVVLLLKSGEGIPLTPSSSLGKIKKQNRVDQITQFLQ